MSGWKTAWRSFYYDKAEEPEDIQLIKAETALLVIDIQNAYLEIPDDPTEAARWQPFFDRMNQTVIPNTATLAELCRESSIEVMFARIACLTDDGRDRSLSQKNQVSITCCYQRIGKTVISLMHSPHKPMKSPYLRPQIVL